MGPDISESALLDMAKEKAEDTRKKDCTVKYLQQEAPLIKAAMEMIDISNVFLGPYSNTALHKIDECLDVLNKNFEEIPEVNKARIEKRLNKLKQVLDMKLKYGKKVDDYLRKRESSLVEMIKDRVMDTDLEKYEKIMNKMSRFKTDLVKRSDDLCKVVNRL